MSCISNSNAAGMNSPKKFWHEFIFSLFSKLRSRLSQKASPCKILTTFVTLSWPPYSVANNLMSYWHSLQSQESSVQVIYYYFAIRKNGTHVMICIFGNKLKKKLKSVKEFEVIFHGSYWWIFMLIKCGHPYLNVFHLKWIIGAHGNWKHKNHGGRFGATS